MTKCKNCGHQIVQNPDNSYWHIHRKKGTPMFCAAYTKAKILRKENEVLLSICHCSNPEPIKEGKKT